MTAKNIARYLLVGSMTTLAASAAAQVRRDHLRVRAQRQAVLEETAPPKTDAGPGPDYPLPVEPEAEFLADRGDWDCAGLTMPVEVSATDHEYYQTCWGHILGTFAHWPTTGLDLAETLTANLMLNRGVVPADREESAELPAQWRFPTAQGYREAQNIAEHADTGELPHRELSKALMLYRALFEEVLTAPTLALNS